MSRENYDQIAKELLRARQHILIHGGLNIPLIGLQLVVMPKEYYNDLIRLHKEAINDNKNISDNSH